MINGEPKLDAQYPAAESGRAVASRRQYRQAVTRYGFPVATPTLPEEIAAGQRQADHHDHGSQSEQRVQLLIETGNPQTGKGYGVQRGKQRRAAHDWGNPGGPDQVDRNVLLGSAAKICEDAVGQQPDHGNRRGGRPPREIQRSTPVRRRATWKPPGRPERRAWGASRPAQSCPTAPKRRNSQTPTPQCTRGRWKAASLPNGVGLKIAGRRCGRGVHHGTENEVPVIGPQQQLATAFRVRHHAQNIA